ncbi:MAG: hypothetical protein IIZ39_13310, partial [Blautia sp.]|nr:hypothetical protein [Blautia sp.]
YLMGREMLRLGGKGIVFLARRMYSAVEKLLKKYLSSLTEKIWESLRASMAFREELCREEKMTLTGEEVLLLEAKES